MTGVPKVERETADGLIRAIEAVQLLGAKVILAGISAVIADTLVGIGARFSIIKTTADLQSALEEAKGLLGEETTSARLLAIGSAFRCLAIGLSISDTSTNMGRRRFLHRQASVVSFIGRLSAVCLRNHPFPRRLILNSSHTPRGSSRKVEA
jgi:hypothetical protein